MRIRNIEIPFMKIIYLILYYGFAQFLPSSTTPLIGKFGKYIRFCIVRHIFLKCGSNVNVERRVFFGSGRNIMIGNNSGMGAYSNIPSDTIIGENVMMGPRCYILSLNHCFKRVDIPMNFQGNSSRKQTVIGDDVWLGREVLITPGRIIKNGSIIAARCVLCKDFPEYSIVGGNPSRLIRSRLKD